MLSILAKSLRSAANWFEPRASVENPAMSLQDPDTWRDIWGSSTAEAGESVNVDKALTLSPVWMAVKMISGDLSKIPPKIYERLAEGGKKEDTLHRAYQFVNLDGMANDETSALQLWRSYYASALLFENAYIWIDTDHLGNIFGLYNLMPDRTAPMRYRGRKWYVTEVAGRLVPLPAEDVLHLRGLCWNGQTAPELVTQARHDFGVALAARKFTSKFFANGAQHGGILQIPPGATKEARDKIERAMEEKQRNLERAFKTLVLRDGYKWFSTTVDPQKAETISLDDQQVRHVARWFMLQPSRLGAKDSISYNSEEAAKRDYYETTLDYWLSANQAEMNAKLRTTEEQRTGSRVFRYQITRLMWADSKSLLEMGDKGVTSGIFSPDEVRNWFDLNPRPDGEGGKFLRPLNMAVAGEPDPQPATDNQPPDPPAVDPNTRSAITAMLSDTLGRAVRRLTTHAERAAKDDARWSRFVEQLDAEHRSAIAAMLATECHVASIALRQSIDADSLAGLLIQQFRSAVEVDRHSPADTLAATLPAAILTESTMTD